ncbi:MAG: hypothetical protein JWR76_2501 [Mucilaginibacter sp.]|jgi:hypothetical protein|nr:hypothetical protein [Mucilaginibacter sp.]
MNRLLFNVLLVLCLSTCASYQQLPAKQPGKPVTYSWKVPESFDAEKERPMLKISYDGLKNHNCGIGFRVFILQPGQTADYGLNSTEYAGSFSLGEACQDSFYLPVEKNIKKGDVLVFHIIPIDPKGQVLKSDLKTNFHFNMELHPKESQ